MFRVILTRITAVPWVKGQYILAQVKVSGTKHKSDRKLVKITYVNLG